MSFLDKIIGQKKVQYHVKKDDINFYFSSDANFRTVAADFVNKACTAAEEYMISPDFGFAGDEIYITLSFVGSKGVEFYRAEMSHLLDKKTTSNKITSNSYTRSVEVTKYSHTIKVFVQVYSGKRYKDGVDQAMKLNGYILDRISSQKR